MVVLNKIYTKTGDAGETALGNGSRVAKHSLRVTAYGTTDELNATVGMARLDAEGELDKLLSLIQNDLFDLGADLCRPEMENDKDAEYPPLRIIDAQVDRLEAENVEFKQRTRNGYLQLAKDDPQRFLLLDGRASIEELKNTVMERVDILLGSDS